MPRHHTFQAALVALVLIFLWSPCTAAQESKTEGRKVRVLLVTGANNHDWAHTSRYMAGVLGMTGRFDVSVTENPSEYMAKEDLTAFDVIYLDYNGPRWGEPAETKFLDAVRGGVGVAVIHAANNAFLNWKEYEMLSVFCWRKGTGHGRFHKFDVDVVDFNHPITRSMPPIKNHPDELYHRLVHMHGAKYKLLMTAYSTRESGGTGRVEPMALVTRVGKGRVFHTPLGHVWPNQPDTRVSLADPQLQLLIARGTEWAGTGDCSLKAEDFNLKPYEGTLAKRPVKTWVRRCVLDRRARMVVIQLDQCLSVAFDGATCRPYRIWGGALKLEGTVFDGVHGPQPTTMGTPYTDEFKIGEKRNFLGYVVKDGKITLRYSPLFNDKAIVEETIEHVVKGKPALERRFKIAGLGDGEMITVNFGRPSQVAEFSATLGDGNKMAEQIKGWEDKQADKPMTLKLGNGTHIVTVEYAMGPGEKK